MNSSVFIILVPVKQYIFEVVKFFSERKIPIFRVEENNIDKNKVGIFILEDINVAIDIPTFVVLSNYMEKKEIVKLNHLYTSNLYFFKSIRVEEKAVEKVILEEAVVKEVPVVKKHFIQTFDFTNYPRHLQNENIKEVFLMAFEIADTELDIISPWMNFYVVNDKLISKMEKLLERGVKIYIRYGIYEENEGYDKGRLIKSRQVADMLKERFLAYRGQFTIIEDNIHYKLVLCDEKFMLEGSYNYLSFDGDYNSNKKTRKEGSSFVTDKNYIREQRERYFR